MIQDHNRNNETDENKIQTRMWETVVHLTVVYHELIFYFSLFFRSAMLLRRSIYIYIIVMIKIIRSKCSYAKRMNEKSIECQYNMLTKQKIKPLSPTRCS